MYGHLWAISGQLKPIYYIRLMRILKYNMFLNYYRVFPSKFVLHSLLQIIISTVLPSYVLDIKVNKWRSQLELRCLVSVFTSSLTLHPFAKRARMQHNLAPNKGLEAKAEMNKWTIWTLYHIWRFTSIPIDGALSCVLKNEATWPVVWSSSDPKRWWKQRE